MGVTATLLVHRIHGLPADRDIEHAEHLVSNRPRLTFQQAMSRIRVSRTSRGHARPTTDKASSRAFMHGIPDIVNRRAGVERDVRTPVSLPPSERTAPTAPLRPRLRRPPVLAELRGRAQRRWRTVVVTNLVTTLPTACTAPRLRVTLRRTGEPADGALQR